MEDKGLSKLFFAKIDELMDVKDSVERAVRFHQVFGIYGTDMLSKAQWLRGMRAEHFGQVWEKRMKGDKR